MIEMALRQCRKARRRAGFRSQGDLSGVLRRETYANSIMLTYVMIPATAPTPMTRSVLRSR